jgi:hypothetical protein
MIPILGNPFTTADATSLKATPSDEGRSLSQQANSLGALERTATNTADRYLPTVELSGSEGQSSLKRWFSGAGRVVLAMASGVGEKIGGAYSATTNGLGAAAGAVEGLYQHPQQIAQAGKAALGSVENAAAVAVSSAAAIGRQAITDPSAALSDTGHALTSAASSVASSLDSAGSAVVDGAMGAGEWVASHPIQTATIAVAAAVEVASVGTATPFLAAAAGLSTAAAVGTGFKLADAMENNSTQISVLMDADQHSAADVAAASAELGSDTSGPIIALGIAAAGTGAAKIIGSLRAGTGAEKIVTNSIPQTSSVTELPIVSRPPVPPPVRVLTDEPVPPATPMPLEARTNDAPLLPPAVTPAPHQGIASSAPESIPDHTATGSTRTSPVPETQTPADPGKTLNPWEAKPTNDAGSDAKTGAQPGPTDNTGRPLSERNAERVAAAHPPLSADELAAQRKGLETDLANYKGSETQSVLDKLKSSGLSENQQDRILNVFAEIRSSYLKVPEGSAPSAEQVNSYRHTIGELSEGLDSAARRGLNPETTQNSLLAAMLSDSHKYGWLPPEGNFFSHHLDGALASGSILSRYAGDGFSSQDIDAVRHAILEHQIGPPQFMGAAYANAIRAGMAKSGTTPTVQDLQNIANIQRMISNPFTAEREADGLGGMRLRFSADERELLRRYVGEGTQNWHVPDASNSWDPVSRGVLASDSFDNYFPRTGMNGEPITGPFKIAGLRGPRNLPPDLTISQAIQALDNNAKQTLDFFTGPDKTVAAERLAQSGKVYDQAKAATETWLRRRLGLPADAPIPADTPYWSKPIAPPPAGSSQAVMQTWRQSPDTQLADDIQQHFAQELYHLRIRN